MTRRRNDKHSTEFGLWLREQKEIDSRYGYIATNIDYLWSNYKSGDWMLLEEKRHLAVSKRWQQSLFKLIDYACRLHPKYKGFHIIRFEHTSPEDGEIILDGQSVTRNQLIEFLQFKAS